jgi:hypothetical protein
MKFYGYESDLVQIAILYDAFSNCKTFRVSPVAGEYIQKGDQAYFVLQPSNHEKVEFEVNGNIDELNSECTVQYLIDAFDRKLNEEYYSLMVTVGENKNDANQKMNKMLVDEYIKVNKINSKTKLDAIIERYYQEYASLTVSK